MDVVHVGLAYCDSCRCKVKSFGAVFSIKTNVPRKHSQGLLQDEYQSCMLACLFKLQLFKCKRKMNKFFDLFYKHYSKIIIFYKFRDIQI